LSLCKALAGKINVTLLFVVSGERFKNESLNIDVSSLPFGVTDNEDKIYGVLPPEVKNFIDEKFHIWFLRTPSRKFMKDFLLRNLRACLSASKLIKRKNFDIIHYNGTSGFIFYFTRFFRKYPAVWTLHDFKAHSGEESKKNVLINKIFVKYNFHFIQHYKYLKDEFIKYFGISGDKVHQVYDGAFDLYNYYSIKDKNTFMNYILFFGRVSKYKGIEYLVEAFDKINKKNINIKLVIAGEGDLWFEKHKISNNKNIIIINRYIDTPELVRLISNCLFVVAPYTDATNSGVVMNSFAFNKPVIASDVGGLREVIKDGITGLLVESKNVDSLKEKIEYLIDNPALLEKMGNNIAGMRKDSEISWNNITEKCIEIYNNVIMNFNL
jgi:glycosyltransferase involved in cell wall biosynthesis